MYMRVVEIKIDPDKIAGFRRLYNERIIPALQQLPGCFCANLMESDETDNEYLSLTLWDEQKHAEAYEKSGLFRKLLEAASPYLSGSSEWKIQLSRDFTLELHGSEEPTVKSYPVIEQSGSEVRIEGASDKMYMRVVAAKIKPGKLQDFKQLYKEKIIPALQPVQGCRYAYLTENIQDADEVFSITIWDSKQDAYNYEQSGLFEQLTDKVQHCLSEMFQWRMSLEKELGKKMATNEDLEVRHYSIVTGKTFGN